MTSCSILRRKYLSVPSLRPRQCTMDLTGETPSRGPIRYWPARRTWGSTCVESIGYYALARPTHMGLHLCGQRQLNYKYLAAKHRPTCRRRCVQRHFATINGGCFVMYSIHISVQEPKSSCGLYRRLLCCIYSLHSVHQCAGYRELLKTQNIHNSTNFQRLNKKSFGWLRNLGLLPVCRPIWRARWARISCGQPRK